MSTPETLYRYKGPDKFPGIPARDLTQADLDNLTPLQRRDVRESTSYQAVEPVTDLSKLHRPELEAYATDAGLQGPYEQYSNKEQLIAAIHKHTRSAGEGGE